MPNGGDGVVKDHPGAGKAHHSANFFPHLWLVAMYPAVGTEGFRLHERAAIGALAGVIVLRCAVWAEGPLRVMVSAAAQGDHLGHHLLFPFPLGLDVFHQLILPCSTE